jgi:hypothetical protein
MGKRLGSFMRAFIFCSGDLFACLGRNSPPGIGPLDFEGWFAGQITIAITQITLGRQAWCIRETAAIFFERKPLTEFCKWSNDFFNIMNGSSFFATFWQAYFFRTYIFEGRGS